MAIVMALYESISIDLFHLDSLSLSVGLLPKALMVGPWHRTLKLGGCVEIIVNIIGLCKAV